MKIKKHPLYGGTSLYICRPDGTEKEIETYEDLVDFIKRFPTTESILMEAALDIKLEEMEENNEIYNS